MYAVIRSGGKQYRVAPGETVMVERLPGNVGGQITFGEVVLLPGQGHIRHNHPHSEEILYVLSGSGEQMVDDKPSFAVRAGDTIYIPTAIFHSSVNTSWEPLRLLALYNPGGAERALIDLPDYRSTPPGRVLGLRRDQV